MTHLLLLASQYAQTGGGHSCTDIRVSTAIYEARYHVLDEHHVLVSRLDFRRETNAIEYTSLAMGFLVY